MPLDRLKIKLVEINSEKYGSHPVLKKFNFIVETLSQKKIWFEEEKIWLELEINSNNEITFIGVEKVCVSAPVEESACDKVKKVIDSAPSKKSTYDKVVKVIDSDDDKRDAYNELAKVWCSDPSKEYAYRQWRLLSADEFKCYAIIIKLITKQESLSSLKNVMRNGQKNIDSFSYGSSFIKILSESKLLTVTTIIGSVTCITFGITALLVGAFVTGITLLILSAVALCMFTVLTALEVYNDKNNPQHDNKAFDGTCKTLTCEIDALGGELDALTCRVNGRGPQEPRHYSDLLNRSPSPVTSSNVERGNDACYTHAAPAKPF